jgi:16S rRNA (cytidine1402-2'-O)-methyltransferase
MGTLYVVATPIGNLEDITLRALKVLKSVGLVAAEDTRHTRKLLTHYGVSVPVESYYEQNERVKAPRLINKLKAGLDVALVTDAGTPGISDPGFRLITLAVENLIPIVPVPGPSAVTTLLPVSGLPIDRFTFLGFVPTAAGRKKAFFAELLGTETTFVMYESPKRLVDTLGCISEVLGDVPVVVGREMTKLHEEVLRGGAVELLDRLKDRDVKGEITLVVRTEKRAQEGVSAATMIEDLLKAGLKLKDVVKAVCREFELPRGEVYKEALAIKERLGL